MYLRPRGAPKPEVNLISLQRSSVNKCAVSSGHVPERLLPRDMRDGSVSAKVKRLSTLLERWPSGLRRTLGKRV